MSEQNPQTRTMPITEVKRKLSRIADEAQRGHARVIIEKSGVPTAALVSVEDLERLSQLDHERSERWQLFEALRAPFRGVPAEEIEREAAEDMSEVRAEKRNARNEANRNPDEFFAIIDEMREAFADIPPEEIEQNAVAIVRQLREANEAAIRIEDGAADERRPA
jgi:prevent-host-death family protein